MQTPRPLLIARLHPQTCEPPPSPLHPAPRPTPPAAAPAAARGARREARVRPLRHRNNFAAAVHARCDTATTLWQHHMHAWQLHTRTPSQPHTCAHVRCSPAPCAASHSASCCSCSSARYCRELRSDSVGLLPPATLAGAGCPDLAKEMEPWPPAGVAPEGVGVRGGGWGACMCPGCIGSWAQPNPEAEGYKAREGAQGVQH